MAGKCAKRRADPTPGRTPPLPAGEALVIGSVWFHEHRHDVSIRVWPMGGARGWPPRSKVSTRSFGALKTGLEIGRRLGCEVHAVAAYDPYYHYVAFNKIAGVLSDEAGKVFRFKEQEQLHEELIDDGIAKIYQSHLDVARRIASEEEGVDIACDLVDGKIYRAILDYVERVGASLLMVGKVGVHADQRLDIGGNAENLLRLAPCHLWLGQATYTPPFDVVAEETISWSNEAEAMLAKAPVHPPHGEEERRGLRPRARRLERHAGRHARGRPSPFRRRRPAGPGRPNHSGRMGPKMIDVVVIGGGISGLAAAWELARRGHEVTVLERQVRVGGNAVSERIDGFLMEHGPSSISDPKELVASWSTQLGLDGARVGLGPEVRRRFLVKDGGLSGIPVHPAGMFTSNYLSPAARLRMLTEPLRPRGAPGADETVAEFFTRRFGGEFLDRVIDPLVGGMFAGVPEDLAMAATFPRMVEMERRHGSIVRAAVHAMRHGRTMPGRKLFSWRDGIATLPAALNSCLGKSVRTGVAVRRVTPERGGYSIDAGRSGTYRARAVIIATQPHVAAALIEPLEPACAAALTNIPAPPLAVVFMGYRRDQIDHPLDGLGYLSARGEGRAVNGALFCSTMFADRAAEDHVAISGCVGGARAPELANMPAGDVADLVRGDVEELLGAHGSPLVTRVRQWPRGLPQFQPGHARTMTVCSEMEQGRPGLFLTGNYLGGVSVAACVDQASTAASRVHDFLSRDSSSFQAAPRIQSIRLGSAPSI